MTHSFVPILCQDIYTTSNQYYLQLCSLMSQLPKNSWLTGLQSVFLQFYMNVYVHVYVINMSRLLWLTTPVKKGRKSFYSHNLITSNFMKFSTIQSLPHHSRWPPDQLYSNFCAIVGLPDRVAMADHGCHRATSGPIRKISVQKKI